MSSQSTSEPLESSLNNEAENLKKFSDIGNFVSFVANKFKNLETRLSQIEKDIQNLSERIEGDR